MARRHRTYAWWVGLLVCVMELAVVWTPAFADSVKHDDLAADHDALAAEHATQATAHRGLATEHATQAVEHGALAADHDAQTIEHATQAAEHGQISSQINALQTALGLPATGVRFVDNGNGTITDHQTGLMWLKLDNAGGPLDKDNQFTWDETFSIWLPQVNGLNTTNATDNRLGVSFAGGYTDWRLPTIVELQTIIDTTVAGCNVLPFTTLCVHPIFNTNCTAGCANTALNPANACSCTANFDYWASTTNAAFPSSAWTVRVSRGFDFILPFDKGNKMGVRAVRSVR